eukprot:CAMPEP_0174696716 /NCGR_PEP_ID=MMETSP1094-20130205/2791_1 /TAXON_ID=156173 /ORGANISM="Chrysochromulina brevifilum, Strain UTEX LB 985" /LENGTH=235 /DNA_ID=CAMNT_0015893547 /DNA_START=27 /DNA_END=734 /DNA_ORIENTATION=+
MSCHTLSTKNSRVAASLVKGAVVHQRRSTLTFQHDMMTAPPLSPPRSSPALSPVRLSSPSKQQPPSSPLRPSPPLRPSLYGEDGLSSPIRTVPSSPIRRVELPRRSDLPPRAEEAPRAALFGGTAGAGAGSGAPRPRVHALSPTGLSVALVLGSQMLGEDENGEEDEKQVERAARRAAQAAASQPIAGRRTLTTPATLTPLAGSPKASGPPPEYLTLEQFAKQETLGGKVLTFKR